MIYLDYQATTPVAPEVLAAMLPWFSERFANPHSLDHRCGQDAAAAVEEARQRVAAVLDCRPRRVVFTSGATEANNLAICGGARMMRSRHGRQRVVTVATEHSCVLASCARLAREGFSVEVLPVARDGLLDMDRLAAAVDDTTALVSVMAVNNEIGVIQPVAEIARPVHAAGALLHCDAAQALGKTDLAGAVRGADLVSLSAHKAYGPKGIGALFVARALVPEPLFAGGGQERGLRPGTLPVPLCVGFGHACTLAAESWRHDSERFLRWRTLMLAALTEVGGSLNGALEPRVAGNLAMGFDGLDTRELLHAMPELAVSGGAACQSADGGGSHVLAALGHRPDRLRANIRLCFGRPTTADEVGRATEILIAAVQRLRRQ